MIPFRNSAWLTCPVGSRLHKFLTSLLFTFDDGKIRRYLDIWDRTIQRVSDVLDMQLIKGSHSIQHAISQVLFEALASHPGCCGALMFSGCWYLALNSFKETHKKWHTKNMLPEEHIPGSRYTFLRCSLLQPFAVYYTSLAPDLAPKYIFSLPPL